MTLFTSNDIVILTLTPLVLYASKEAKINVIPFLIVQFYAANILSAAFIIGNPTNVIVGTLFFVFIRSLINALIAVCSSSTYTIGEAIGLTFGTFVQWMALPAIVAVFGGLFSLLYVFRKELTETFVQPEMDPYDALIDRTGGTRVFLSIVFVANFSFFF